MEEGIKSGLKQRDVTTREVTTVAKPEARVEETSTSDFERSNMLVQIVSKFGQIIRRVSVGDYRDELAQLYPELRIKYHVSEITRQLQAAINLKVPDFDSASYSSKLAENLVSMRGRELPGFTSARLLMGSVFVDLENLRSEVDEALFRAADVFLMTVNKLAERIAENFPLVRVALMGVAEKCCARQSADMSRRSVEIFERSTGGAINDKEMIIRLCLALDFDHYQLRCQLWRTRLTAHSVLRSINQIRWDRFDRALDDSLSSAREAFRGGSTKEDLKRQFKSRLGPAYMRSHAVGEGLGAQLEDAKAALKAYWRVSEARLLDDVTSCIDMVLLQNCPALIEQALMTEVQNWMSVETLGQILDQDPRSLSPNSDRNEHLRGTEIFKAQLEQSVIPSDGVGSRAGSLCPSGFNAVGSRAAEVSQKGGEDSKMLIAEMRVEHSLNERDIPVPSSTDTASSKDAVDHQAGNRGQELNSVAVFTHQFESSFALLMPDHFNITKADGDDNGLVYWLGTRGQSQLFRSPMTFGQLDVQSSGVHIGSHLGNENSLVSRSSEEVRLINTPFCWICVDVGRTRAISPTRLCVVHGSSSQGCDITKWDAEGRDLDSLEWVSLSLTPSENGTEKSGLGTLPSENKAASFELYAKGRNYSQIRLISTGLQMNGMHSFSLRAIELYGVFYRLPAQ